MPPIHWEALLFCLAWAGLALAGFLWAGLIVGALLSVGLLVLISASSLQVLQRTDDTDMERQVRWGILVLAALALFVGLQIAG